MPKKKVKIEIRDWYYECGDGCCSDTGSELHLDGVAVGNQYTGDDAEAALEAVLSALGYNVEITRTQEDA